MKKKILILNGQYIPGYKGGGPIRSCVNMIEKLSNKFDFYVLTSDRDYKSDKAYENVKINQWNQVGSAKVFYMSPDIQTIRGFKQIINNIDYDCMYLNGFFSPIFTIKPLVLNRLNMISNTKIIITPRGDFTGGCENKKLKKYLYIYFSKIVGLYKDLMWHATSEIEEIDIKKKFKNANTYLISNLSSKYIQKDKLIIKKEGELKLVFISRIFPKKNLKFALEILKEVKVGSVTFDIYGPMEDKAYWAECEKLIKHMPSNIIVNYKGELEHSNIAETFQKYHAFLFPTIGENYGHVIVEAMMNNCLVILSRGVTPWDDYDRECGLIESLNNMKGFIDICNKLVLMNSYDYNIYLNNTANYIRKKLESFDDEIKYFEMLNKGMK